MNSEVKQYFEWILNLSERGIELLVWMYRANILCEPCRIALEAVEALADD